MIHDDEIDATGLLCPLPVLKIRKKLKTVNSGEILLVLADDPASVVDIPHFCNEQGHQLLKSDNSKANLAFLIKKK